METGDVIFRRMRRVMAEQEREPTVLEPLEIAAGGPAEESTVDQAPASVDALQSPAQPIVNEEPVSRAEYDQMKAERDQLLDRIARLQAEFENARKRGERERLEFRDYATGAVVEQFLPVLDNFELALKSNGTAHQLRSGVTLIVKQMEDVLRQMQVVPVPAVGEAFDPRVHEALGSVERDDLPDQHVAEEIRRGYKLRERLLRPALVRIAHNPKQTSE
jgi:molecular chaperone GrpE